MTTNYNTAMAYDAQSRLSSVSALVYTNDEWRAELLISNRNDHIGRRVKKITPAATHTFFYETRIHPRSLAIMVLRAGGKRRLAVPPPGRRLSQTRLARMCFAGVKH